MVKLSFMLEHEDYTGRKIQVDVIKDTIDSNRIRVQTVQGKRRPEMWGIVWLDEPPSLESPFPFMRWFRGFKIPGKLPFCFRAWPSNKKVEFLQNGLSTENTKWGFVHVPYEPWGFTTPIFTEPLTMDDKGYLLRGLGVKEKDIRKAEEKGRIDNLLGKVLGKRSKDYQRFRECYNQKPEFRRAYGTAISLACDEKVKSLITS